MKNKFYNFQEFNKLNDNINGLEFKLILTEHDDINYSKNSYV